MKKYVFGFFFLFFFTTTIILGIHYYINTGKLRVEEKQNENENIEIEKFSRKGTYIDVRNVNFRFKKNISLELPNLQGELIPKKGSTVVNFDDVNAFIIRITNGEAYANPEVLKTLFVDYVFNFESSTLKLKKVEFPEEVGNKIKLSGELNFLLWLEFEMMGTIGLEKKTNQIVITAEEIKAVGNSYIKSLLSAIGLNLEKLIPIPDGKGVTIKSNQIFISPFIVFPPPKLEGKFSIIDVKNSKLHLVLSSDEIISFPSPPDSLAKNYLFLYKGEVKFGKLFMVDANLQMIDTDETDNFDFFMPEYFKTLTSGGKATIKPDMSVKVIMPDYGDVFKN
ncbi:MAG: hypothetical protein SFU98_08915 [Leptospiraceae bacterium]|nr:hypothetical protein [Leptospiraceae bacterium]